MSFSGSSHHQAAGPPSSFTSIINQIQGALNFDKIEHPLFATNRGIGRIAVAGFVLGIVFGVHFSVLMFPLLYPVQPCLIRWSLYMVSLSFFHFSEFFTTALYKPETATYDSFIINHSHAYTIAAMSSWTEYWIELLLFPSLKRGSWSLVLGGLLLLGGQFCRILAMHTAKSNFSHTIMEKREKGHQLVTHGIYKYLRHPSYFGWFWWSVGSQVLLFNPLCIIAYTVVSWRFFASRIRYEENTLCNFYPQEYSAYRQRTYVGIPFIN